MTGLTASPARWHHREEIRAANSARSPRPVARYRRRPASDGSDVTSPLLLHAPERDVDAPSRQPSARRGNQFQPVTGLPYREQFQNGSFGCRQ